jgi:hypothetical protein
MSPCNFSAVYIMFFCKRAQSGIFAASEIYEMAWAGPGSGCETVDRVKFAEGSFSGAGNSEWCKSHARENRTRGDLVCSPRGDVVSSRRRAATTLL